MLSALFIAINLKLLNLPYQLIHADVAVDGKTYEGHDALPNWQKCSADDGGLSELCRAQSYQCSGGGGDIGLLAAEYR